ncbi:MAG: MFS transporter [Chthonomonadaceae bacterium]|nr:MFS transporter [Chthonomonadaceae bacterium]
MASVLSRTTRRRARRSLRVLPRTCSAMRRRLGRSVPDDVWYNWRWDLLAGICAGIYQGCIWSFALQLARGPLGASGWQMGLASAAPAIGYLFALLWARQMEGRAKLPFVTRTWLVSRGLFLLTPLLVTGRFQLPAFLFLICATPILFSISTPAYTAIMKDIYPDEHRGRLMSLVRVGTTGAMLITTPLMGWLQEHAGLDFRWMFALGGAFGIATAGAFSRLRLPRTPPTPPPPVGQFLRETFRVVFENPGYRWFTASVFVTGFGNLVAGTLYPIYQVDHFRITPTQIGIMTNALTIAALISLFFWGWFLDRYGSLTVVLLAVTINCLTPICYLLAPSIQWIYLAAACTGFAQSGIDLGYLNTTLMFAETGKAAQYQAVHSTFFGLRGTIAPLLAIPLLHAAGGNFQRAFLICTGIMLAGLGLQAVSLGSYRRQQRARTSATEALENAACRTS